MSTAPDERAFADDVAKARFVVGVADGRWRIVKSAWPNVQIAVRAKDDREFVLRFNCVGFPNSPPTARLWDPIQDCALPRDQFPRSNGGRVGAVFRTDWKDGTALYLPCDREAIAGHDNWHREMPSKIWRPSDGIVQYLELVHELLQSRDYASVRTAA